MEIEKLLDKVGKEENLYTLTVKLAQRAYQLRDKREGPDKVANPVATALEEELAERNK